MTTAARAGQFTGATDNAASGGLFTDTKVDGIPDLVAADVASAQTSATTATTQAATATTQATTATTKATEAATSATAAASSATAAASSATTASTGGSTATTKAAEASTSATNAATSETNAATSATNAAASASSASTQATNATTQANSALSSASAASTSATAAAASFDSFDDRYLGAKGSDPSADNDGNSLATGALYFKTGDGMRVYNGSAWEDVKPTSSEQTNINTVAAANSNITTVAGNVTNINAVGGISSNVTSVANISSDVTSLANSLEKTYTVTVTNPGSGNVFVLGSDGNAPAIEMFRGNTYVFNQSDATNDGHPLVFKNSSSAYETGVTYFLNGSEATQSNYVNTTTFDAGRASGTRKVQIEVASNAPSSGLRYYCYIHGNGMGNTITVKDSNISLVAGSIANVNTTAGSISNVNTVAGAVTNVNTVATNITGVNSFADRYRVASSAPSSSLDEGDLYFDTNSNELKAYNGSAWQSTSPSSSDQTNINIVAGEITAQEDLGSIANAVTTSSGNNINTVGSAISNVNTVAGISSNVTTVAGISSNVSTVAGISSNVTTVANNVAGVTSFAEKYRVAGSAPSSSLDEGDLYYNTSSNTLNYYNGSSWVAVVAGAMTSLAIDTTPQLGGDLDVNGNDIVSAGNGHITIDPHGVGEIKLNGTVNTTNLTIDFGSIA